MTRLERRESWRSTMIARFNAAGGFTIAALVAVLLLLALLNARWSG